MLLNNEASQRQQNIPSPLSDTAISVEPWQREEKHQDDVSETPTDPEQLQENLQLPPCETVQASATKKEVSEHDRERGGGEREREREREKV